MSMASLMVKSEFPGICKMRTCPVGGSDPDYARKDKENIS